MNTNATKCAYEDIMYCKRMMNKYDIEDNDIFLNKFGYKCSFNQRALIDIDYRNISSVK